MFFKVFIPLTAVRISQDKGLDNTARKWPPPRRWPVFPPADVSTSWLEAERLNGGRSIGSWFDFDIDEVRKFQMVKVVFLSYMIPPCQPLVQVQHFI